VSFISSNIEQIVNVLGSVVLIVCAVLVFMKRDWQNNDIRLFARGFFGVALLGDTYWALYTLVFGVNPQYFYGAELAWLAEEIFLLLLVIELYSKEGLEAIHPGGWVIPAIIALLTGWFIIESGDPVFNVLMGFTMAGIALFACSGLFRAKKDAQKGIKRHTGLYSAAIAFVVSEYAMWSISIVNDASDITNPYYLFSILMYVSLLMIALAVRKLDVTPVLNGDDA